VPVIQNPTVIQLANISVKWTFLSSQEGKGRYMQKIKIPAAIRDIGHSEHFQSPGMNCHVLLL
jgi:hypothetical protein